MSHIDLLDLELALVPERYDHLCQLVTARLPLREAAEVLALMAAAERLRQRQNPTVALGRVLGLELEPQPPRKPYDQNIDRG